MSVTVDVVNTERGGGELSSFFFRVLCVSRPFILAVPSNALPAMFLASRLSSVRSDLTSLFTVPRLQLILWNRNQ